MGTTQTIRRSCAVKPETIDGISEQIRGFLAQNGVDREICLRMGLVTEEILIALDRAVPSLSADQRSQVQTMQMRCFHRLSLWARRSIV